MGLLLCDERLELADDEVARPVPRLAELPREMVVRLDFTDLLLLWRPVDLHVDSFMIHKF